MYKMCAKCKQTKEDSEFYKLKNRLSGYCRKCGITERVRCSQRMRDFLKIGKCCQLCGYSKFVGALEFHHVNPSEKKSEIGKLIVSCSNSSLNRLIDELKKTVLICTNCHREVHGGVASIENIPRFTPPDHGSFIYNQLRYKSTQVTRDRTEKLRIERKQAAKLHAEKWASIHAQCREMRNSMTYGKISEILKISNAMAYIAIHGRLVKNGGVRPCCELCKSNGTSYIPRKKL